jgi:predicted acetyltransferase
MDIEIGQIKDGFVFTEEIFQAISNEKNLSHRSKKEIAKEINRGNLYAVKSGKKLISFAFVSPLNHAYDEINAVYTVPEMRGQGYYSQLLNYLLKKNKKNLIAVAFRDYSIKIFLKHDFKEIAFFRLPFMVKIPFIIKRLKIKRLRSIIKFCRQSKPRYLLFKK